MRATTWIIPTLLAAGLAACGGGLSVGFGYWEYDHDHDHPKREWPRKPQNEGALLLIAGDVCNQCASSVDGTGSAARFNKPEGVAVDGAGNLYVAEPSGAVIRKITPQNVVTTLAGSAGAPGALDGTGAGARFNLPSRLATDSAGNVYVIDSGNSTVRRITPAGVVTTLAGVAGLCGSADGQGSGAQFCNPRGIALDQSGNLYVTDTQNHTVRRIDPGGRVTTVAGLAGACGSADGRALAARFCEPQDIAVDKWGNLFVADTANSTVRQIKPNGEVTTIAGQAGVCGAADGGESARFCRNSGIEVDAAGDLYVADTGNSTIRRITPPGRVTTVAGMAGSTGFAIGALPGVLDAPPGIAMTGNDTFALTSGNLVLELSVTRR